MIYWKFRFNFGKTTLEGLKKLQEIEYRIKCISFTHYLFLSFIKYLFMILLVPFVVTGMLINNICKLLMLIIEKPINKYLQYFLK